MREAILARHGESESSVRGTVNGDPSVPVRLTPRGAEQARRLGRLLAGDPIELCVITEFLRVRETADLALEGREVPRLVVPELNEILYGAFEGELLAAYRVWARDRGPTDVPPGDGESSAETVARYVRGWRAVLARPERTILVVGHSLAIRYVLNATRGLDPTPVVDQVACAEPHRLPARELERAVARLAAWSLRPVWAAP